MDDVRENVTIYDVYEIGDFSSYMTSWNFNLFPLIIFGNVLKVLHNCDLTIPSKSQLDYPRLDFGNVGQAIHKISSKMLSRASLLACHAPWPVTWWESWLGSHVSDVKHVFGCGARCQLCILVWGAVGPLADNSFSQATSHIIWLRAWLQHGLSAMLLKQRYD